MAFPATFADIQQAVIVKARLDGTNDLAKVKDWINQTYYEVCVEAESLVTQATVTLTAATTSYTFPAEMARLRQMFVTPFGATSVLQQPPMTRTSYDDILMKRQLGGITQQSGAYSTHYAFMGENDFEVWPTPAAADVITLAYAAFPTVLSADGDLQVLDEPYGSKMLEYGALVQAGDFKGDPSTGEWANNFNEWMGRYMHHLERKQGDIPTQGRTWGTLDDTSILYSG